MHIKYIFTIIFSCVVISGCASNTKYWDSSEPKSSQEFYKDRSECNAMSRYQIQQPVYYDPSPSGLASGFMSGFNIAGANDSGYDRGIFNDCMMGRGWYLVSKDETGGRRQNKKPENNEVMNALYRTKYLRDWYDSKNDKFNYAVDIDDKLKSDPAWSNKTLDERFAEATRLTRIHFGEIKG